MIFISVDGLYAIFLSLRSVESKYVFGSHSSFSLCYKIEKKSGFSYLSDVTHVEQILLCI